MSALSCVDEEGTHRLVALVDGSKTASANLFVHGIVAESLSPTAGFRPFRCEVSILILSVFFVLPGNTWLSGHIWEHDDVTKSPQGDDRVMEEQKKRESVSLR